MQVIHRRRPTNAIITMGSASSWNWSSHDEMMQPPSTIAIRVDRQDRKLRMASSRLRSVATALSHSSTYPVSIMLQLTRLATLASAAVCLLSTSLLSGCSATMDLCGVNYNIRNGPDWETNAKLKCKSELDVEADLAALAEITSNIRIYSLMDCNQGELVLKAAAKHGLKVAVGLWVGKNGKGFVEEKKRLLELIDQGLVTKNAVTSIHVGSEALYRDDVTEEQIVDYLAQVKLVLKDRQLSIKATIADIGDIYIRHGGLLDKVDFVSANGFPFWEKHDINGAADHFYSRMKPLMDDAKAKGLDFVISETGWASQGSHVNASTATPANAAQYLKDFYKLAVEHGWKYYYFEAFDEEWKNAEVKNRNGVEGHFGIFTKERKMKPEFAALELTGGGCRHEDAENTPAPSSETPAPSSETPAPTDGCTVKT